VQIAVFGGSFDPPHIGHEAIVKEACKSLDIDKMLVVPTFLNPFKEASLIDPKNRLILIKKLFNKTENVEVCEYEVNQNRAVNSIETIEYIKKEYNPSKIYFIVGADNFKSIHTWNSYDRLKNLVEFVVASRECSKQNFENVKLLDIDIKISSTTLRHSLNLEYIPKIIQNDVNEIWHKKRAN